MEENSTALIPQAGGDLEVINYYSEAVKLKEYAERREIKTLDDLKVAADDMTIISRLKKAMEEKRRESLKPHQDKVKEISDNFKFLMEPVEAANQVTRDKIGAFNDEQKHRQREQEEVNRLRVEAAQKEAALNGGEISEPVNLVEITEPVKRVSNEMGGIGMVDSWKWRVIDFAAVPDAYKVIDSSQLTAIARKHHDQKPVPGVRFFNEPTVRVSTK